MPGSVDSSTGYLGTVPNIGIDGYRLVDRLRERYPVPVEVGNDVNLGTLAECWLGAGREAQTVVGMFVGTGIGGGVVIDGRLRTGPEDLAGEIGHMVLMVDGPECGCGNLGCFEALASRTAIERAIRDGLADGRSRHHQYRLRSHQERRARTRLRTVMSLCRGDDARRISWLRDPDDPPSAQPDMVIMGRGGLKPASSSDATDRAGGAGPCMRARATHLQITVSELGDDAVALGAAALVRRRSMTCPSRMRPEPAAEPEAGRRRGRRRSRRLWRSVSAWTTRASTRSLAP